MSDVKKYMINWLEINTGLSTQSIYDFANEVDVKYTKALALNSVSTCTFDNDCELYIDNDSDQWVFKYKREVIKISKSKWDCLIAKKALQKHLGV
jgi:hypothetical protein